MKFRDVYDKTTHCTTEQAMYIVASFKKHNEDIEATMRDVCAHFGWSPRQFDLALRDLVSIHET